jgi:hypothetical protein
MGKCLTKYQNKSEDKVGLEEYIEKIKKRNDIQRPTIKSFQLVSTSSNFYTVSKAEVKDDLIVKSQLIELVQEAISLNASKIYSDYSVYSEARKVDSDPNKYKKSVISQISLLKKNLKKFPHQFSSKYLITQSIYQNSLDHYKKNKSVRKAVDRSMFKAFKNEQNWDCVPGVDKILEVLEKVFGFWDQYLNTFQIRDLDDVIVAKAKEGDFLIPDMIDEIDLNIGLFQSRFYDNLNSNFQKPRVKYLKYMQILSEKASLTEEIIYFGAISLINLI